MSQECRHGIFNVTKVSMIVLAIKIICYSDMQCLTQTRKLCFVVRKFITVNLSLLPIGKLYICMYKTYSTLDVLNFTLN